MNNLENGLVDGEYIAEIISIENTVDKKNRSIVEWKLTVTGNDGQGVILRKRHYLNSQKSIDYLKKELERIGIIAADGKEFEQKRRQANGLKVKMTVSTNDHGYQVYYVQGVVQGDNLCTPILVGW